MWGLKMRLGFTSMGGYSFTLYAVSTQQGRKNSTFSKVGGYFRLKYSNKTKYLRRQLNYFTYIAPMRQWSALDKLVPDKQTM